MRDSMVLYRSFAEAMDELPAEQYKEAMQAITKYAMDGIEPDCSRVVKAIFLMAKPQIDRGVHFLDGQNARHSSEYQKWRDEVFKRDDYTCQKCGKRGVKLNAHHIVPFSESIELRTVLSNGITLCEECHREVHHGE